MRHAGYSPYGPRTSLHSGLLEIDRLDARDLPLAHNGALAIALRHGTGLSCTTTAMARHTWAQNWAYICISIINIYIYVYMHIYICICTHGCSRNRSATGVEYLSCVRHINKQYVYIRSTLYEAEGLVLASGFRSFSFNHGRTRMHTGTLPKGCRKGVEKSLPGPQQCVK